MRDKRMKIAFICGPYRAASINGVRRNIDRARAVSLELWELGFAVICPHANTAFFDGALPDEVWLDGAVEIMKRAADVVVLVPGWQNSDGAIAEMWVARRERIPALRWPEDKIELQRIAAKLDK